MGSSVAVVSEGHRVDECDVRTFEVVGFELGIVGARVRTRGSIGLGDEDKHESIASTPSMIAPKNRRITTSKIAATTTRHNAAASGACLSV
jgi:hypothetical protein